jgi:sialic acid synthase SpsE/sugar phosphate isomerase/epimerase
MNIQLGSKIIGKDHPTYIIAEIGINHNGDEDLARQLIDKAVEAGVDAVKFQKRDLASLYRKDVLDTPEKYEQNFQYMIPLLKDIELSQDAFTRLKDYSEKQNITFLCTPFDIPSARFLIKLGVPGIKVASADFTNIELLEELAGYNLPLLLSTGMTTWKEIELVVEFLKKENCNFALLHCRSVYPVWPREVNLRMLNRLSSFGCPVGYSGHELGIVIPLAAASMGAAIIEKHITIDRGMAGPDHKVSLKPYEFKRLVRDIRIADQASGTSERFLLRGEVLNRELFGKSLMASTNIEQGEIITREKIKVLGPGKGLSPLMINELKGRRSNRFIPENQYFTDEDLADHTMNEQLSFSFRSKWGLIARFSDAESFLAYKPKVIEFHLAEKDFDLPVNLSDCPGCELVVHCPEYMGEELYDLCSSDEKIRSQSLALTRKTIALTSEISHHFDGKAKVIVHPGAMSLNTKLDPEILQKNLEQSLDDLRQELPDVELLFENLPPYPWYFGGQWKGNYFLSAQEIDEFCRHNKIGICFDLSHAILYCNAKGEDFFSYTQKILQHIRHIHFADGYGLDGEGIQIGEGDIDFEKIMPLFNDYNRTWVPEVWRGHLDNGKGFFTALQRLQKYEL